MGAVIPTSPHIKAAILKDIQENGVSVSEAADKHGVSYKTVYNWLTRKSKGTSVSWGDYNRMKNENQRLKEIIGELTLNLSHTKKN
jgi:transposase-like protein